MENDIISNTLINDSTIIIIRKLYRLAFIFLIINIFYSMLSVMNIYVLINNNSSITKLSARYFFYHTIVPTTTILILLLGLFSGFFMYNGYGLIYRAIKDKDALLTLKGFTKLYIGFILVACSYVFSIMEMVCPFFLSN